ncbi:MAG: mycothiol conjugate amidase Mca, partial [Acidimicrobiia bacterium]|nr:mycothiol conjugate amidase Mca [Acidimicrobiia bacterium]
YDKKWFERPSNDERHTTHIDVTGLYDVRAGALKAHATQIDPLSPFWFGLPDEVAATVYPRDDFILAQSEVPTELPEDDLFAGISVTV